MCYFYHKAEFGFKATHSRENMSLEDYINSIGLISKSVITK